LQGDGIVIRGLDLRNFGGSAVLVNGGSGSSIVGNSIGSQTSTDLFGIQVDATATPVANLTIGGNALVDRNVISGNSGINANPDGAGIRVLGPFTSDIVIQGNLIGTSPDGAAARPNDDGVVIDGSPGVRVLDNVIGGNGRYGVFVTDTFVEDGVELTGVRV